MKFKKIFIVCFLLSLNFLNVSCYDGYIPRGRWLPIVYAVKENDIEEVKRLLSGEKCPPDTWDVERSMNLGKCYDANLKDTSGETALFYIKTVAMAELLISKGADIEAKNNFGETPLYVAVDKKRYRMAAFLFGQGANPHTVAEDGSTPLLAAKFYSRWYTFRLNRLIEKFEAYSPPEETIEETEEQTSDTTQLDTTQPDVSDTSQSDVSKITQPDTVEIEPDFLLFP